MLSRRLAEIVASLPLVPGMRILEIGCGPGAMAREMAIRLGSGYVLGIDRSQTAIDKAKSIAAPGPSAAELEYRCVAVEHFALENGEALFDLAVAVRVGALDGRYPQIGELALGRLSKALKPDGLLVIDGKRRSILPANFQ